MTVKYQYTCNLCVGALNDKDNGIALRWDGNELTPADTWRDAPIHLCHKCIAAVAKLNPCKDAAA